MKIATYNIWNDNRGWPDRVEQICDEIKTQNADLLCLQDVPDEDTCKYIAEEGKYGFYSFVKHPSCELAILSKYPFLDDYSFGEAQIVNVKAGNYVLEVINVHLPWDSVLSCEKQVIALVNQNKKQKQITLFSAEILTARPGAVSRIFSSVSRAFMGRKPYHIGKIWQ